MMEEKHKEKYMTLGKKLSNHRKLLGMTQQQLGDYLNLSAQAISKWENDLAEPDLATLKTLAGLYKVSIDELLDVEPHGTPAQMADVDTVAATLSNAIDEKLNSTPKTIGFCKNCGIAVTEENLGTREPIVKCKACVAAAKAAEALKAQQQRKKLEDERIARDKARRRNSYNLTRRRNKSFIVAGLVSGVFLFLLIVGAVQDFDLQGLLFGLVITYAIFSLVSMLFFDTPVGNVISYMCTASIKWPGLIFTFDLDGILWLIGMKLLFALLGFLFGLLCAALGILIGLIIAPFVFPYIMVKLHRDIKNGTVGDYAV